ncbi:MAG TPA: gliding motility-associated C-terminal domain-containing protein [Flavobacteriaceae bacterium]|nr:gliding motility-associated C-terminal domain-containing protein [Flavobacteriaceae bacterium]
MRKNTTTLLPPKFPFYGMILIGLLMVFPIKGWTQNVLVTELVGSPPDFTDWTTVNINTEGDEIILTPAQSTQAGALFYSTPYNLNQCLKWKVEFDFRIYGGDPHADGLAFWFLENPPTSFEDGQALGMPSDGLGLKVAFDTYDNDQGLPGHRPNPEIQVYYGLGYDETFPEPDMLKSYAPDLVSSSYQHAIIDWDEGEIQITIDGEEMLTGTPTPFDGAEDITDGYFGFSASTGLYYDRHSIKNVKVYIDVLDLESDYVTISQCDFEGDGFSSFDLTIVEDEFIYDEEATFEYFVDYDEALAGTNPIDDPTDFENQEEGADEIIYVRVANENGCSTVAFLHLLLDEPIETLTDQIELPAQCIDEEENNYDLTTDLSSFVENPENYDFEFYENEEGAIDQNDEMIIEEPENFLAGIGETVVYVRIEKPEGTCFEIVSIVMHNYEMPIIEETVDIDICGQAGVFEFDLTINNELILGEQNPEDFQISYYSSQEDADLKQNVIETPESYFKETTGCNTIYIRLENREAEECYTTDSFEICAAEVDIGIPADLEVCFDETDVFDLTSTYDEILNSQPQEDFSIAFYTSLEDAENAENPIENPTNYQPEEDTATIYYRVETQTDADCFEIGSFEVQFYYIELLEIALGLEVCRDENFDLTEIEENLQLDENQEVVGYYQTLDDFETGMTISDPTNYTISDEEATVYAKVEGADMVCPVVYSISLRQVECELFIPEGFSPNEDGFNDTFEISNLDNFPNYSLKIYSRYGRLVYEGKPNDAPWDGTSKNGDDLPTGVYYYVLDLKQNNPTEKGWVYLNR